MWVISVSDNPIFQVEHVLISTVAPQMHSLNLTAIFFIFCTCHFYGSSPFFSLLKLASSACKYLQCIISALTQVGKNDHLFRLIVSVVLWRGSGTENKHHWHKWWALLLYRQHWGCHSPIQHALHRSKTLKFSDALWAHSPRWAMCLVHLPGPSLSGSRVWRDCKSQVAHVSL